MKTRKSSATMINEVWGKSSVDEKSVKILIHIIAFVVKNY